jgi:hypothetical protein
MSQTPTFSQPPEPLTSTSSRPAALSQPEAHAVLEETIRRLRSELAATADRSRQSRLLTEIADLEERGGDEPAAARGWSASSRSAGA